MNSAVISCESLVSAGRVGVEGDEEEEEEEEGSKQEASVWSLIDCFSISQAQFAS